MKKHIAVIGLGYVGLPLALAFSKKFTTSGFDISSARIDELKKGHDKTLEATPEELRAADTLSFTSNPEDIQDCNVFVVTVPTPVDVHKKPDLTPLLRASETVGRILKKGDLVIYESTVYPGCTEEECIPVLEKCSGLKFNVDFTCGYSPERINPGDKEHTITKIKKVTSGSTPQAADDVDQLYGSIIVAGTHKVSSIRVAEAAKVIENSQRDINIAFVNELALIFQKIGIDTTEVLEAAGTKWNFLPFRPGLVGGHCIGVDPYYLTYKAESLGYHPQVILAGRRINDGMGAHVAGQVIKLLIKKEHRVSAARVLVLGVTFKENCPDIRNSRVIDIVEELREFGCDVSVCDPWANSEEVRNEFGLNLVEKVSDLKAGHFDAVILAVSHRDFKEMDVRRFVNENGVVYDVKSFLATGSADARL